MMSDPRWLDTTKNHELRDALNFVGIPASAGGATLATQQGTRGSPIVDAACVPGLELYKVSPLAGRGISAPTAPGASTITWSRSPSYLWSSAGNLDLAFLMLNSGATGFNFECGIILRGDRLDATQPDDVFGANPSEMVLVSGTHAWRIRFSGPSLTAGVSNPAGVASAGSSVDQRPFNGWDPAGGGQRFGSEFPESTPLPFLVYRFWAGNRLAAQPTGRNARRDPSRHGGTQLKSLMEANYATFRIYDFTLTRLAGGGSPLFTEAAMPPSISGLDTSNPQTSQNTDNYNYWYIPDAIVAPRSPRSISVRSSWVSERTVASPATINIADVLSAAFEAIPSSEPVAIGMTPETLSGAVVSYNSSSRAFQFASTTPGIYRVFFTAALRNEPGKRAEAVLTITVT